MSRTYYVYHLIDPRSGKPYYVGETNNKRAREAQHCERKAPSNPAEEHNQEILDEGQRPKMEVLKTFDNRLQALLYEIYYIIDYIETGYDILNREALSYVYDQARKLTADARINSKLTRKRRKGISNRPSRSGRPWDTDEDRALLNQYDSGMALSTIANNHQRSEKAITTRLSELGREV